MKESFKFDLTSLILIVGWFGLVTVVGVFVAGL